jgi:hypothetical protein
MSGEDHSEDLDKLQDISRFRKPAPSSDDPTQELTQKLTPPAADEQPPVADKPHPARGFAPPGGARDDNTEELPLLNPLDGDTKPLPRISASELLDKGEELIDLGPYRDLYRRSMEEPKKKKKRGRKRGDPPQTEPPKTNPQ